MLRGTNEVSESKFPIRIIPIDCQSTYIVILRMVLKKFIWHVTFSILHKRYRSRNLIFWVIVQISFVIVSSAGLFFVMMNLIRNRACSRKGKALNWQALDPEPQLPNSQTREWSMELSLWCSGPPPHKDFKFWWFGTVFGLQTQAYQL